jgi:hypothetical protein
MAKTGMSNCHTPPNIIATQKQNLLQNKKLAFLTFSAWINVSRPFEKAAY